MLKGMAILMMVFLHLFNNMKNVDLCNHLVYIGDVPLVNWLSRATNPVAFYLLLSGYGLYNTHKVGKDLNSWKRVLKLYRIYWICLLLMAGIGCFVAPALYPGSLTTIIKNITGWHTTYNGEAWFLFPYILLVLTARPIFRLIDRFDWKIVIGGAFFLTLTTAAFISLISSRAEYGWIFSSMIIYQPILYLNCLGTFMFGGVLCKLSDRFEIKKHVSNKLLCLAFVSLILLRCIFNTDGITFFYVTSFIILFTKIHWCTACKRILSFFGKHSTTMWLTHTYFCYYLFHDFIYGFKYPIVIYAVTLVCSLIISEIAMRINNAIFLGWAARQ